MTMTQREMKETRCFGPRQDLSILYLVGGVGRADRARLQHPPRCTKVDWPTKVVRTIYSAQANLIRHGRGKAGVH
jgi:hypothetical protein